MDAAENANTTQVSKGTEILIGEPLEPMPQEQRDAIAELLRGERIVLEAHLPQMQVAGFIDTPRQALVVVLQDMSRGADVATYLAAKLVPLFPEGELLPIVPVDRRSDVLPPVRRTGTCVKERRPTWKFWG